VTGLGLTTAAAVLSGCRVVKSTMGMGTETGVSMGFVWENGTRESAMAPAGYSKVSSSLPSEDIYLDACQYSR
jgi:hypothetical protein